MNGSIAQSTQSLRRKVLTISVGAVFGVSLSSAELALGLPTHIAASHQVTSCSNAGPGSLRAVIADPMTVGGDIIDLTPLKMVCSRITLDSEIAIPQDTLFLEGAGSKYLSVDGNQHSRVFHHTGSGTLVVSDLTVSNGLYSSTNGGFSFGGCIYSKANVSLISSVVSDCTVNNSVNGVVGGGLYVKGNLTLLNSSLTANAATGDDVSAFGGGAWVKGDFQALYSTISGNAVEVSGSKARGGGGAILGGNVTIGESTIYGNWTDGDAGALRIASSAIPPYTATITNTTISGNIAAHFGGIFAAIPTSIANSTIAFNRGLASYGNGVYIFGTTLDAQSSIIADNWYSTKATDISGTAGSSVGGSNNLILASTLPLPMDTIQACPKLDVLANNGGHTLTHGLKPTSPVIDKGAAPASLTQDQRMAPRVTGAHADVGAVEWRSADRLERLLASGFDGLCDQ